MARIPTKVQGQRFRSFTLILLIGLFLGLGFWLYQKGGEKGMSLDQNITLPSPSENGEQKNKESPVQEKPSPSPFNAEEESADFTIYQNKTAGFELKHPKLWKVVSIGSTSISLSSQDVASISEIDNKNIFITFAYLPLLSEKPKSISEWVLNNNAKLLSSAEIKNKKETEIGGLSAICQEVDSRNAENISGGILSICYILRNDKIISLSYFAKNEETTQKYKSDFDNIIKSVKYIQ